MPPWVYLALLTGEPADPFSSPVAMRLWTDWAAVISTAESQASSGPTVTSETY